MKKIAILFIVVAMMCSCGNRNKTENVDNQIDTTEVVDSVENTLKIVSPDTCLRTRAYFFNRNYFWF